MNENLIGVEENLYLAPEEKIENAKEIAELSLEMEKNSYIIKYTPTEGENIISELEKIGCFDFKQLNFANCVAVLISNSQLKAIKTLDCVETVERDYDYKILVNSVEEGNLVDRLSGEKSNNILKKEIRIAVFDTGVSDLAINGSVSFVDKTTEDNNGHGTQMAGIISSVVTSAENKVASPSIYSVVVADYRGFAKTSTIMQALDWAINNGIKIVCMSFGDYHKSKLLENMINRASNCGIVMVAAAGNDGGFEDENRIMYPAAFDNVLSVGAKNGDTIANYSNGGENADCFANGSHRTTDINGNAVNVIGTSGATAFVAGTILKNWCVSPEKTSLEIIADIKTEMSLSIGADTSETLTLTKENDIIFDEKDNITSTIAEPNARSLDEGVSLLCVGDNCDDGCSSNDMASAISLPFLNWRSGSITCPGNEVWYKFTANASGVHPNGSPGWYTVHTQGSLDTVGYLYDSYGNQIAYNDDGGNGLNFNFWAQLEYYETYYIRVKAYGSNTGNFDIRVSYFDDDHGNTMDSATEVIGVYYHDKSITGELHSQDDVDYYTFVPAENCVMEIYTEGDTNTYGQLYCASGGLLASDTNGNSNGNFKITAHLEAMKRYYITVSHNSSTGYGEYTLRFKFVKDYMCATGISRCWRNDEYDKDDTQKMIKGYAYLKGNDISLWRNKISNQTFKNTIGALAQQSFDELIEYFLLEGFSPSLSYSICDFILSLSEVISSSFPLEEFNVAYNEYLDNGTTGYIVIESFTTSLKNNFTGQVIYNSHDYSEYYSNTQYLYGGLYCRGTWVDFNL